MAHQQNIGRLAAHLCDMAFLRGVAGSISGLYVSPTFQALSSPSCVARLTFPGTEPIHKGWLRNEAKVGRNVTPLVAEIGPFLA